MGLIKGRSRVEDGIPTSSMADIAFLLLVFFLVTTVFPKDKGLSLILPQGESPVAESNVLHLLVQESGVIGVRWGASQQTHFVRAEDVASIWRRGVADNPNLIAAVRTDPAAAYGRTVDVLDQLQGAGAARVSLQSLQNR